MLQGVRYLVIAAIVFYAVTYVLFSIRFPICHFCGANVKMRIHL